MNQGSSVFAFRRVFWLACVHVLLAVGLAHGTEIIQDQVRYVLSDDGQAYAAFCESVDIEGDIVILEAIDEIPVTRIGEGGFAECAGLRSVQLPGQLTTLEARAFAKCVQLTSIQLPNSVTTVGDECFSGCTAMTSAALSTHLRTIGERGFNNCGKLGSITLPEGLESIGVRGFYVCSSLKKIRIPASVNFIGSLAFCGCSRLTAFDVAAGNSSYASVDGVLFDKAVTQLIAYPIRKTGEEYTIPNGVTTLDGDAFGDNRELRRVVMPSTVTTIHDGAFYHCNRLEEVTLSSGLTEIAEGVFFECDKLLEVVVPEGVTKICDIAFAYCSSLKKVTLPETLEEIGSEAFYWCSSLEEIPLPVSLRRIGIMAFGGTSCLAQLALRGDSTAFAVQDGILFSADGTRLVACSGGNEVSLYEIPPQVTTIDQGAFIWNRFLEEVWIPAGVEDIGPYAFMGCERLRAIHVDAANAAYSSEDDVLYNKEKSVLIAYPAGREGDSFVVPASVRRIEPSAFAWSTELQAVMIPETVEEIGSRAFYRSGALTSIGLRNGGVFLEEEAFYGCESLMDVWLPEELVENWEELFLFCAEGCRVHVMEALVLQLAAGWHLVPLVWDLEGSTAWNLCERGVHMLTSKGNFALAPNAKAFAPGKAFWIHVDEPEALTLYGSPADGESAPWLYGWNLIAVLQDEPEWTSWISCAWEWQGGHYVPLALEDISRGKACWVFVPMGALPREQP